VVASRSGAELREGGHFAILRKLALDAAGDLLHGLGLRPSRRATRQADVHGRPDALIERSVSRKIWPSVMEMTLVRM